MSVLAMPIFAAHFCQIIMHRFARRPAHRAAPRKKGYAPFPAKLQLMLDAHCHLDDPALPENERRAYLNSGLKAVCAGYSHERFPIQGSFPKSIANCYGLHPWIASDYSDINAATDIVRQFAAKHKTYGIGEIGLDAMRAQTPAELEKQTRLFRAQLALARELNLPVVLHNVRMHAEMLEILKRDGLPKTCGMLHGFSGKPELARQYLRHGLYISMSGAAIIRQRAGALSTIPKDKLLLETDAPGSLPSPYLFSKITRIASAMLNLSQEELENITEANAIRLFAIERNV